MNKNYLVRMQQSLITQIQSRLQLPTQSIRQTLALLKEGATVPFIARYRKERTGSLDETQIRNIEMEAKRQMQMEDRKQTVLKAILEQGKLSPALEKRILDCTDTPTLEDIYLPFKRKRKTRAAKARDRGLESLADWIWKQYPDSVRPKASKYVSELVGNADEAIQGAKDILSEKIAEMDWVRQKLRDDYQRHGIIKAQAIPAKTNENQKYRDYFDYQEKLSRCPSHRYLAISRGEAEGILRIKIQIDEGRSLYPVRKRLMKNNTPSTAIIGEAIDEAFIRLIKPSLENETRQWYKEKADAAAIDIFQNNLKQLLLSPPVGQKSILALDPGFRTGCKLVCLNTWGDLQYHTTIFPHPPQSDHAKAKEILKQLFDKYKIEVIAIGNGTAGRETMRFVQNIQLVSPPDIFLVSEQGASIYSASEVAREEFPDHDVTVRGAISIGRRLMDPLAELVKIDPKSIGVGQYQHDVNQKMLKESLDQTVESCVNTVGININTASHHLLQYVSGLGKVLAKNMVQFRTENGPFQSRSELLHVDRLGTAAFQQCAGFLRIQNAENPLDNTAVHPEAYLLVEKMAMDQGCSVDDLIRSRTLRENININEYVSEQVGLPTLRDIMQEIEKPGRDPRGKAKPVRFNESIKSIEDLIIGSSLSGIVTNITKFGAFIDIGIKENGLVHISEMADKFVDDPMKILSLGQEVMVRVLAVDIGMKRVQLSMKSQIITEN